MILTGISYDTNFKHIAGVAQTVLGVGGSSLFIIHILIFLFGEGGGLSGLDHVL